MKCERCDGCGRIASSDDGEPWTAWENLPPGSDLAVRAGIVKPLWCPDCAGTGKCRPSLATHDVRLLEAAPELLAVVKDLVTVLECREPGELEGLDVDGPLERARAILVRVES